jgi:phosphoribosylformylglycinamidine cyclo-ligase
MHTIEPMKPVIESQTSRYEARGVSSHKPDVFKAIANDSSGMFPTMTTKVIPDILGLDEKYCNILHSDGVGSKSALAYMHWKEMHDLQVWHDLVKDAIVMNTDDLACAGAIGPMILNLTINRNKFLIPPSVIEALIHGAESYMAELREMGFQIQFGGGETADTGDVVRTIQVDASAVTRVKHSCIIRPNIQHGDVIIGFSSEGRAKYENKYNSGISCNGLTMARHDMLRHEFAARHPETFDPGLPPSLVYNGKYGLSDRIDPSEWNESIPELTIGELLLSPSRTYIPLLKKILEDHANKIHGIIHCTGGGQTKALRYAERVRIVKNNMLPIPVVFRMIKSNSGVSWKEMFSVFNMGHRLEIYCKEKDAFDMIEISKKMGIHAGIVGYCEKSDEPEMLIKTIYGDYSYKKSDLYK